MAKVLPILECGRFKPEVTYIVLGYMFYPNDKRAAHQLADLLLQEFEAEEKKLSLSELAETVFSKLGLGHLCLVGEMSLFIANNIRENGRPFISKAAFVVSQNHGTDKRRDGSPLPTTETALRKRFYEYSSVLHLWAAFWLQEVTPGHSNISELLSLSHLILTVLQEAEFNFSYEPWTVPMFDGLRKYEWPEGSLIENPDAVDKILEDYKSRTGT